MHDLVSLSSVLRQEVFPNFDSSNDFCNCREVCKQWFKSTEYLLDTYKLVEKRKFGKKTWEALGVNFEKTPIPPMINGMVKWLKSPCDFYANKIRLETGSLLLEIEGISVAKLQDLMHKKFPTMRYEKLYLDEENSALKQSQWVWIADDLIPKTIWAYNPFQFTIEELIKRKTILLKTITHPSGESLYNAAKMIDIVANCYLHYIKNNRERLLEVEDIHGIRRWALCDRPGIGLPSSVGLFSPIKEKYGKNDFFGGNGLCISRYDSGDSSYDFVGYIAVRKF